MKFVNAKGEVGYGRFQTFVTIAVDFPSARGLTAQVSADAKQITWSNGDVWIRAGEASKKQLPPQDASKDATFTIVEYLDLQCKYCKDAHFTLKNLVQEYDGRVKILYKHYPLNFHNWAQDAALAAVCVAQQNPDGFLKFADYVYINQASITKETFPGVLRDFAAQASMDASQLQRCMAEDSSKAKVAADVAEAQNQGVNAVPAFLINGKIVAGAKSADEFRRMIDDGFAHAQ